jgi:hypothetical protein
VRDFIVRPAWQSQHPPPRLSWRRRLRNGSGIYCFIRSVIQWRLKPGSHLCRPTSPSAPTFYLLQQCDQDGNSDGRKQRRVDSILVLVRLQNRNQPSSATSAASLIARPSTYEVEETHHRRVEERLVGELGCFPRGQE